MENKEKLKKLAGSIVKILDVFKILCIVGIVICAIASIVSLCFGLTGVLYNIYEAHPQIGKIEFEVGSLTIANKTIIENKYTIQYLYENHFLNEICFGGSMVCLVGVIEIIIFMVIIKFIKPIFSSLNESETPFTYEIAKKLRIAFILATLIVLLKSLFAAIIIGGLLGCIYFIILYGCKLQENEDQTL